MPLYIATAATAVVLASLLTTAIAAPKDIPGIGDAVVGVNMFQTNPNGDGGRDSALGNLPIFSLASTQGRSWNGEWVIPDALSFRPSPSCSYTASSTTVRSTYGYLQTLHEWVITKFHFLFWSHTDDREFHEVSSRTASSKYVLTQAKAACTAYETAINEDALTPAMLTPQFVQDVTNLPEDASSPASLQALLRFVQNWGTSYISSALFGGSVTISTQFSQDNYTMLESESTNLDLGASLAFLSHFGDSRLASDSNFREYERFVESAMNYSVAFVGPSVPPNGTDIRLNSTRWANNILLPSGSPAMTGYIAANLTSLLARPDLFPGIEPASLLLKLLALEEFITTHYCEQVGCQQYVRQSHWTNGPSLPVPLRSVAVVSDGQRVYVVGGASTNAPSTSVKTGMLVLDMTAPEPRTFKQLPPPFYGAGAPQQDGLSAAAAAVNTSDGSVWVCGGVNAAGTALDGIARYTPSAKQWAVQGALQTARQSHCSVVIGTVMLAFGGVDGSGNALDSVEAYDSAQHTTTARQPMPQPRAGHACTVVGSSVWVTGGLEAGSASATILSYDPLHDTWSTIDQPLPEARVDHSAALVGASLFILGGASDASGTPATANFVLNTTSGLFSGWQQTLPISPGRVAAGAAVAYQPNTALARGEPANGGHVIVLVGGSAVAGQQSAALSSSTMLKVYDTHGSFVYNPQPSPQLAGRGGGQLALQDLQNQLHAIRAGDAQRAKETAARQRRIRDLAISSTPPHGQLEPHHHKAMDPTGMPVWPYVDLLSHTYNFIRATPGAQRDAGWLARGAFQVACAACFTQNKTLNGQYAIPDGISVNQLDASACSYEASSLTMRTAAELQASLFLFAELNSWSFDMQDLLFSSFSAGVDTKVSTSASIDAEGAIIAASASCNAFEMALDSYDFTPAFNQGFSNAVAALPANFSNPFAWLAFFEEYGLAYPTSMTVGSRATQIDAVAEIDFHQLLQVSASVDVKASVSFLFLFGASANAGGAFHFKEWIDFSEHVAVNTTQCQPQCPPAGPDIVKSAGAWRERALETPVPLSFKLAPIWDLIAPPAARMEAAARLFGGSSVDHDAPKGLLHHTHATLHGQAVARSDKQAALRLADAAAMLHQFAATQYCPLTPGCSKLGGKPYWNRPEANAAQRLPQPLAWAAGGSVPLLPGGNTTAVVVAGGVVAGGDAVSSQTLIFDTAAPSRGWLSAMPMKNPVSHAAYVESNGFLLVLGGVTGAGVATDSTSAFQVTAEGGEWTSLGALPGPLARSAAAAANNTIVVFGGCTDGPSCADVSNAVYVGTASVSSGSITLGFVNGSHTLPQGPARDVTAVASADGATVFVAGGVDASGDLAPYVYAYNVALGTWDLSATTAAPMAFAASAAVVLDNSRILLTSGIMTDPVSGTTDISGATFLFDPESAAWEVMGQAPWPAQGAVSVLLPDGPPAAASSASTAAVNSSLPALWLVGGLNGTATTSPALSLVAQLRNLPAA